MVLNKCNLGALQTLKTKSAYKQEHDSVVLSDSRKDCILGLFWNIVLALLGCPIIKNNVSRDA